MQAEPQRPVTVVVDSTSDIPRAVRESLGIVSVPLNVAFGDATFKDEIGLAPAEFLSRLTSSDVTPTTSQPAVPDFAAAFQAAIDRGHDVLCLTIASELSGTFNAARLAAESVEADRVRVVDGRTVSIHSGLGAIAAARAARTGVGLDEVESAALDTISRGQIFVVLETLEYLRRGGRIGKAQALVGSVLNLKPVLTVRDGHVMPLERVRTWRKAQDRMAEMIREQGPLEALAVYHAGNLDGARAMADRLGDVVPRDDILIGDIGSVVSTYSGPGALGLVPIRARM